MPSIANQDYKIYGRLADRIGIPGKYCGELYSSIAKASSQNSTDEYEALLADSFVFDGELSLIRQNGVGKYYDVATQEMVIVEPTYDVYSYYDAIWAIQQAGYANDGTILSGDTEFGITPDGIFGEMGYGVTFINEDGYFICGTASDGKLASLYLGEKAENPVGCAVVRLESLLPLVGKLPLGTTEIW